VENVNEFLLAVQDKQVGDKNRFVYGLGEDDWIGNRMFVNGVPEPFQEVPAGPVRLRILNAANARVIRLAFVARGTRLPFHLIGTDGGMLERPQRIDTLFLAPAQRIDLLVDFGRLDAGERVRMTSLAYDAMENDGNPVDPRVEHPGAPLMGEAMDIMEWRIAGGPRNALKVPKAFASLDPVAAPAVSRRFRLHIENRRWLINGRNFHDEGHRHPFAVKGGGWEAWEIRNEMASMPHPMHIHGFHFRVVSRAGSPAHVRAAATAPAGRGPQDLGWLDTVLVWPGETVRVAIDFRPALPGTNTYMFHCHNLEHEDQGLMAAFSVTA